MYRQTPFRVDDPDWCRAFAAAHGFPTVVVTTATGTTLTGHGACVVQDADTVELHLARANPVSAALIDAGDAGLATELVFLGDHGYVSPRWYADPAHHVPTWNYEAVHASGRLVHLDDEATRAHLAELAGTHEPLDGWTIATAASHVDRILPGMAAFRLHVEVWEGQRKLSQNRDDDDRAAVGRELSNSVRDVDRRLGRAVLAELAERSRETARHAVVGGPEDAEAISLDDFELRLPTAADRDLLVEASLRSRALWTGWGGPPTDAEGFDAWLARVDPETMHRNLAFFKGDLLGIVSLQNIVRGQGQYATLGYSGFLPLAGRGLMRRAVALGVDLAFSELDLHRVEAGVQPSNVRSVALIRALGFRYEGLLRRLVKIDDDWRDHELWATDVEDWPGATAIFPS